MAKSLLNQIKASHKIISKSLTESNPNPWLRDNFYIIHRHYRLLIKNKKPLKYIDFYKLLHTYCENCDYQADANTLKAYLLAKNKHFSFYELSAVKPLLAANAIIKLTEMLTEGKNISLLPNTIKLLISLSHPQYEDILADLWAPERIIAKYEENYHNFDAATKTQYRSLIAAYARKRNMDESDAAKNLTAEAKRRNCPLGNLIFRSNKAFRLGWCIILAVVFALLTALSVCCMGWLTLLLLVPFALAASSVADQIIALKAPSYRSPRLNLTNVPDNAKTLVTIAALMSGNERDNSVFEALSRFRYMNTGKNIYFCLLADFPDSNEQYHLSDKEIVLSAQRKIDELNSIHGNCFCLFFRERVLNKSEGTYGGWERKRGAVCELISHIRHGGKTEYYGGDFIRDIKYLLTLDSDTNLSVGSVTELLSLALHPVNRPVIKDGRVVSGYGIIQPAIRTELSSAYKTGFSRLISGAGGADIYAAAGFQRSQALFGSGEFCGKGLIDVALFDSLINGKLPQGLVLSHDHIEGGILRTLSATDITLTDSTPGNTVSFFRRHHRWMRGDFQNLYFLKGRLLPKQGKWRVLLTVFRHASPVFSLFALIMGCFLPETSGLCLLFLAYSDIFLPALFTLARFMLSGSPFGAVRFFSKAYSLFTQTGIRIIFDLSSVARRAMLTLHAYILAASRMITGKKTLEWTTAAATERLSSSLGKYVLDSALSVVIGLAMLIFAIPPFMRFAGLLFFVYPLVSYVLSRPLGGGIISGPSLTDRQKNMLISHAKDMLAFYAENVDETTNYLPPDNIQFSPVSAVAMRTSPTNIGFYLVCLLAARDLDVINSKTLFERLDSSLTTVENLDKYKGNLYNWYDISNLTVLDNFVSTVDSGNFIVMLIALKEGLYEYAEEEPHLHEIVSRIKHIIDETDLTALYDSRLELFKIGIKPEADNSKIGCYDLLMSEARMTGYYAVASQKVGKKHWGNLGRTLTHYRGYIGMMSWSGTAFEYLMPQLFLPLYRDSFMFESIAFSLMIQRSGNHLWGISESGFYSFDSDMNYQYKANGLQPIALRRIADDEKIISPYSTYLSLVVLGNSAIKNLKALESKGMYGKYGLYEALDLNNSSGGICVKSYMAHHVGMSIIAIMNAVRDNIFVERFMADKQMGSAIELLQEKIPIDAHVFEDEKANLTQTKHQSKPYLGVTDKTDLQNPNIAVLSRGDMSAFISSNGHISLNSGDKILTNTYFDKYSLRFSPCVLFSRGDKAYGCTPLYGENESYSFQKGETFVSHIASGKDFSGRVRYSMAKNCPCLIVSTRAEVIKKYDITLAFEPVMDTLKKFRSHISFSRLFVESEYDKTKRILYFHRRSGQNGRHIFTIAVAPRDKDMNITFLASKESFRASSISSPLDYAFCDTDNKSGVSIDPLCLIRAENAEGGRATFLITCGETKSQCEYNIRQARNGKNEYPLPQLNDLCSDLLPSLLYGRGNAKCEKFTSCNINDLWSKSISGDYPLAVISLSSPAVTLTKSVLEAYLTLNKAFLKCELIFLTLDSDKYNRPAEASVRSCCADMGCNQYISRKGGIFILRQGDISEDLLKGLINSSHFYMDFSKGFIPAPAEPYSITVTKQNNPPMPTPSGALPSQNGCFIDQGFAVDKSQLPNAPYSFILTGYRFSTVITQSSLGYSFFDNARERRICSFFGDSRTTDIGERLLLSLNGREYDLCAVSSKAVFQKGFAEYYGEIQGNSYKITLCVSPKFPVKLINVKLSKPCEVNFRMKPVMGDSIAPVNGIEVMPFSEGENSCIMFRNPFGMTFPEGYGFAGVLGGSSQAEYCALKAQGTEMLFFLGACTTQRGARAVSAVVNRAFFQKELENAIAFADSLLPKIKITTKSKYTDALLNFFAPYQISACRFYARGSFYQSGGAYGFRDQLQDSLGMIYSNPKAVRTHIIRCCAHQYEDGSVMHWWHTKNYNQVNRGIKSKCSDDLLYLPLVVADYLIKTEDKSLLNVPVHYLVSPPLGNTSERYEQPNRSHIKESVYNHCLKALNHALKTGRHGLILMGSCDWNDAFSLVGERGIGESVFTTLLYIIVAEAFIPVCEKMGDIANAEQYKANVAKLRKAVEDNAFFGDRYARAFCDDGTILGIEDSEECKIDILSQAFAAMAGLNKERVKTALNTAFTKLYDSKNRIFRLFSPSFTKGSANVGYIRGYVSGIRENGGQYTHGALWGALGCITAGMQEEGLLILDCANPATRTQNKELAQKYKAEPYAIAADIYSGEYSGRGGWSWYTGAAAWFYRMFIEYVLGIKYGANQTLISVKPIIPFNAEICLDNAKLSITAGNRTESPLLNGEKISFPLSIPDGEHILEIPINSNDLS